MIRTTPTPTSTVQNPQQEKASVASELIEKLQKADAKTRELGSKFFPNLDFQQNLEELERDKGIFYGIIRVSIINNPKITVDRLNSLKEFLEYPYLPVMSFLARVLGERFIVVGEMKTNGFGKLVIESLKRKNPNFDFPYSEKQLDDYCAHYSKFFEKKGQKELMEYINGLRNFAFGAVQYTKQAASGV